MASATQLKRHKFTAHHAGASQEAEVINVWMHAEGWTEASPDSLILQRSLLPDDDTPGIGGVYIEIPIQREAVYGGMTDVALCRDGLTIHFADSIAVKFGGYTQVIVHLSLSDEQFVELRDGLRVIFRGCSCYHEPSA
jgi:Immunity protein 10